ncbi:hypothetical protein BN7874_257 [Phage NCTB]|nr:hypothetical protein BN7874_257 [Phage NCTB]
MLHFKFDKTVAAQMRSRGADGSVFQGSKIEYDLETSLVSFKPKIGDDIKSKPISVAAQLEYATQLLEEPFKYPDTIACVNSYPTDLRAKVFAANIMETAVFECIDGNRDRSHNRMPYWYRMYGDSKYGYIKHIRDQRPSLLILSNITTESSPARLEMLRDILVHFDSIPRIVVLGGDDPVNFFSKRMFTSLSHVVRIGPSNRIHASPLDV